MQRYQSNQPSIKDELIYLVALFGLFLGIALLYLTWPGCLVLIPIWIALILIAKPQLRRDVVACLVERKLSIDIGKFRSSLIAWFTVLAMVTALICLRTDDMEWWLIPLSLAALAFRLGERSLDEDRPSIVRSVCANFFELSLLACVVLILYLLAEIWLLGVSLDNKTLGTLVRWQQRLEKTHKFFEDYVPRWWVFLFTALFSVTLRICASSRPAFAGFSERTIAMLAIGFKWFARISTISALAASLTLLATGVSQLSGRISLTLRDAEVAYEEFASRVNTQVDVLMRQSLRNQSLRQRPPALKAQMLQAAKFIKDREYYEGKSQKAKKAFQVSLEQKVFPIASPDLKTGHAIEPVKLDPIPALLTPRAIELANQEAKASLSPSKPEDETEELAGKMFEQILSDQLSKNAASLELIKAHFPVVGEFVDAILASVSETVFARSREIIVRRVMKKKLENDGAPLTSMMNSEVAEISKGYDLDLKRFNSSWRSKNSELLSIYSQGIELTLRRLEALSIERQREFIRVAGQEASQRAHFLSELGVALDSPVLSRRSSSVELYSKQLAVTGENWPALHPAPSHLIGQLNALSIKISHDKLLASEIVIELPEADKTAETGNYAPISPAEHFSSSSVISPTDPALWSLAKRSELPQGVQTDPLEKWRGSVARERAELLKDHTFVVTVAPQLPTGESPLRAIRLLRSYCDEQIIQIVAKSHDYQQESTKLQRALGDHYYLAYLPGLVGTRTLSPGCRRRSAAASNAKSC